MKDLSSYVIVRIEAHRRPGRGARRIAALMGDEGIAVSEGAVRAALDRLREERIADDVDRPFAAACAAHLEDLRRVYGSRHNG